VRLLWVEDEKPLLEEGMLFLRDEGFTVVPAGTYAEAWEQLERSSFDLVLLDWLLPDRPGIELCKQIQQRWKIPVIMLTAKSDEFDKVLALEIGADDYVSKPFGMRELAARIRAVTRRMSKGSGMPAGWSDDGVIKRGDLTIDPERHTVYRGTEEIALTKTEFALLYAMASRPSKVFSRLQLMDEALGDAFIGYERTIDSHIRNLRKKLGDESRYVVTVHGIGYKFEVGQANQRMGVTGSFPWR